MRTWDNMKKAVEKYVKAYKDDFYVYDRAFYKDVKNGEPFLWATRDGGTQFLRLTPEYKESTADVFDFYKDFKDIRFFLIEKNRSFKAISRKTAESLIDATPDAS